MILPRTGGGHPAAVSLLALGFIGSILAFFPGWMSIDSLVAYDNALKGVYSDWQPVLMAHYWRQLNKIYSGPALFLVQNLLFYWGSFYLIYRASRPYLGRWAVALVLVGFWPGLLFLMGQIWKDIVFGTSFLLAMSLIFALPTFTPVQRWAARAGIAFSLVLGIGVKTNGLSAAPVVLLYWAWAELPHVHWVRKLGFAAIGTALAFAATVAAVPRGRIIQAHPFQYMQTYDLLALSVQKDDLLLPRYVVDKLGLRRGDLKRYFFAGSNNLLFYNSGHNLATTDAAELSDLNRLWLENVQKDPIGYLGVRLEQFAQLLRLGSTVPAWTAVPETPENPYGISFKPNEFSDLLAATVKAAPWMYLPWCYGLMLLASMGLILWRRPPVHILGFVLCANAAAWLFVLPHLFIAPASDFRYLYFAYLCAVPALLLPALAAFRSAKISPGCKP